MVLSQSDHNEDVVKGHCVLSKVRSEEDSKLIKEHSNQECKLWLSLQENRRHTQIESNSEKINGVMFILGYHLDYIWTGVNLNKVDRHTCEGFFLIKSFEMERPTLNPDLLKWGNAP